MVGQRLLALLAARGATIPRVAAQIGEPRSTVDRCFRGANLPALDKAVKLAEFFDVSLDELVGLRGPAEPEHPVYRAIAQIGPDEAYRRILGAAPQPAAKITVPRTTDETARKPG